MKINKFILISAVAVASVTSNLAAATPTSGTFDQGANLVSYSDGNVFGSAGSPTLYSSFDYTYSFNLLATSAFTGVVDGWWGMSGMSGTLYGTSNGLTTLTAVGNHLSFGSISGDSSYILHIMGTAPASGQTFNVNLSSVAAVPEPETFAMLLAGLGLIGMVTRRRSQMATA